MDETGDSKSTRDDGDMAQQQKYHQHQSLRSQVSAGLYRPCLLFEMHPTNEGESSTVDLLLIIFILADLSINYY